MRGTDWISRAGPQISVTDGEMLWVEKCGLVRAFTDARAHAHIHLWPPPAVVSRC